MFYYGGLKYTYPPIFRNVIFANYKIETAMNDEMKYLFRKLTVSEILPSAFDRSEE